MKMKLYGDALRISPFVHSVYLALSKRNIPFEYCPVNLHLNEQNSTKYVDLLPTGVVPMLEHNGLKVFESNGILEYLEEAVPPSESHPSIYPKDLESRMVARSISAWLRANFEALRSDRSAETIFYSELRATTPLSKRSLRLKERLIRLSLPLAQNANPYLFGAWSISDFDLSFMLKRLVANGDELPEILVRYCERVWAEPELQSWVDLKREKFSSYE